MALHIRQEQTEKLARDVAKRAGETLTAAVHTALEERLARMMAVDQAAEDAYVARIHAIAEKCAAAMRAAGVTKTSTELLDELYGEDGLPI